MCIHVSTLVWLVLKESLSDNGRALKPLNCFPEGWAQRIFFFFCKNAYDKQSIRQVHVRGIDISKARDMLSAARSTFKLKLKLKLNAYNFLYNDIYARNAHLWRAWLKRWTNPSNYASSVYEQYFCKSNKLGSLVDSQIYVTSWFTRNTRCYQ